MTSGYEQLRIDIAAKHGSLSPVLRQVAEFALHHPNEMALETIAAIAARVKVPPSSLIRFARAFGYDGFSAMQRVFRTKLVALSTDHAERLQALRRSGVASGAGRGLDQLALAGIRALEHLRATVPPDKVERAVDLLAEAEAIHIAGQRGAFAVAVYLGHAIGQLGRRTHLLDGVGGMTLHQAEFMTPRDVLVLASFAPDVPETLAVAERAAQLGVPIVLLTDGPLSPLVPLARVAFEIEDAAVEGVRSLAAAMCLALALVVRLGQRLRLRPAAGGRGRRARRSAGSIR
jgi:DNA-binding MurR/RpiR family transcriptional regulator